jgi:hypothetical protein
VPVFARTIQSTEPVPSLQQALAGLLKDAVFRAIQASTLIGVRSLLCHAIDEEAMGFYLKHGFVSSPLDPLTLMLGLRTG